MKKKQSKKHLKFYIKCMENGFMPKEGLCLLKRTYISSRLLNLFRPTEENKIKLWKDNKSSIYWGSDCFSSRTYEFTTLRQTIVLFLAAINNEL